MRNDILWAGIDRIADPEVSWDPKRWTNDLAGHILQAQGWQVAEVPCFEQECAESDDKCTGQWALVLNEVTIMGEEILGAAIDSLEPNQIEALALELALRATEVSLPQLIDFACKWAPEEAASRAKGERQYDQDRQEAHLAADTAALVDDLVAAQDSFALAAPAALRDCE